MKTFTGQYSNGNFVYSNDTEAIRAQLISILNTPLGSRFYYPSYGSRLNDYRFDVINYFTINMIAQAIVIERLFSLSKRLTPSSPYIVTPWCW